MQSFNIGTGEIAIDDMVEDLSPYGDVSRGLRASKPKNKNGLVQYIWRMVRFHVGEDVKMPVTCFFDLQDYLDENGIDANVYSIIDDKGHKILDELDNVIDEVALEFGMDSSKAAHRWQEAGLL